MQSTNTCLEKKSDPLRLHWLDNLRATACLMVVALHSAAGYLYQFNEINQSEWMFANIIDSSVRACVPLFFMISGYLLLSEKRPRAHNFFRLISAAAFYSALAIAYRIVSGESFNLKDLATFLVTPAYYHLWFFYAMFVVYIFMSTISIREVKPSAIYIVLFTMLILNPKILIFPQLVGISIQISTPGFLQGDSIYFLGYAIIGAIFAQRRAPSCSRLILPLLLVGYIFSTVLIAVLTFRFSVAADGFVHDFYAYSNPIVVIQAFCLFVIFRRIQFRVPALEKISRISLAIYGVHALILSFLGSQLIAPLHLPTYFEIPLLFTSVTLASYQVSYLLARLDVRKFIH